MEKSKFEILYDDAEAIAFIRKRADELCGEDFLSNLSDDDILLLLDIEDEYYDREGLYENLDEPIDLNALFKYIEQQIAKEKNVDINIEQIKAVVYYDQDYVDHLAEQKPL